MKAAFVAFLKARNSHQNFWFGLGTGIISLGLIGGRVTIDSWVTAHFDGIAGLFRSYVDGGAAVAMYIIWPAIIAAALGRPPYYPNPPKE